jgi:hypothetical protein
MSLDRRAIYACVAGAATGRVLYAAAVHSVETHIPIDRFAFKTDTVTVGRQHRGLDHDDIPHNVVAVADGFRSQALDTDDKFGFEFKMA